MGGCIFVFEFFVDLLELELYDLSVDNDICYESGIGRYSYEVLGVVGCRVKIWCVDERSYCDVVYNWKSIGFFFWCLIVGGSDLFDDDWVGWVSIGGKEE